MGEPLAGLRVGDVVVEVDGVPIERNHDFAGLISGIEVGTDNDVVLVRAGQAFSTTVTIAGR